MPQTHTCTCVLSMRSYEDESFRSREQIPQRAGSRDDLFSPWHWRAFNLLNAGSSRKGHKFQWTSKWIYSVCRERKDWVHSNGCIMINSAILFLPQSSCLRLTAFILSFQELSQLARSHGKIALLVSITTSHQWIHLSVFS